jgi:hypothetical protein
MSSVLGYNVEGTIEGNEVSGFILDIDQIHLIAKDAAVAFRIELAMQAAIAHNDSIVVKDEGFSIEVIRHVIHTPRYVLLKGKAGNRFFSSYDGYARYEVMKLNDGKVAYEIIGFADTVAQAHRKLYGAKHAQFSREVRIEAKKTADTHFSHCCQQHGCKYGDSWCPVVHFGGDGKEKLCCVEARQLEKDEGEE